jgi:vacuolar-type H+-ATPase subunit F/Vma7
MSQLVYIGDEASAAGYRLAGARVYAPDAAQLRDVLAVALAEAAVVMLSAALAGELPATELDHLLAGTRPALLVVPDISAGTPLPDLDTRLRRELGMLE